MNYAVELNPTDGEIRQLVGFVTHAARQYEAAISEFIALNASYPGIGNFGLGWCYWEKKMYPEGDCRATKGNSACGSGPTSGRHPSLCLCARGEEE
jgi:hypothetical protein